MLQLFGCICLATRETLEQRGPNYGTALAAFVLGEWQRRTRCQDSVRRHAGQEINRRPQSHEYGLCCRELLEGYFVGCAT